MDNSSSQSESSSNNTAQPINNSISNKTTSYENISNNIILFKLEEDGFTTPDGKAKELIKELSEIKYLYALKLLFENPLNRFTPKVLRDSLVTLADPKPFDYYDIQSVTRLELHLRTWVAVLEKICFTQMRLSKDLRNRIYNSLPKFVEIHRKTTQVMQEGIDNKYISDFNQFNHRQINNDDNSQTKFDEVSNKVAKALKSTGSFLNVLAGNEPLALPHILWFGILDLAQYLVQKSTRTSTYGLCYYLEIESLNKAPNIIANEMTCPVSSEPEDQLCILKCQHTLSLNNLKKLKQKICPECREKIEENDIRYLLQNSIYKNLYTKFSKSGHILPPIELENSDQIYDTYIYRCLNNYEQAHLYLNEAINLKPRRPIAYLIRGEILFWQNDYETAVDNLWKSKKL
ncbi:hypothetical protein GLOIN_2v476723 [Rhizophagus irregularis DAOM 181602=DAOM 197198]|nr:hypothetical protein GLOIN_2v476723 [Rhizophagus irregularis DAOM 181602=DAOM 197198]